MVRGHGSDSPQMHPLAGIKRRDIGSPGFDSNRVGRWLFTEPGSGWECRLDGYLDHCWQLARVNFAHQKFTKFGIIDCVDLDM